MAPSRDALRTVVRLLEGALRPLSPRVDIVVIIRARVDSMVRVIAFLVPTAAVVTLGVLCALPISALVEWLPTPRPTFTLCLPEGTRRSTFKTATHELEVEVTSEESCGYFECEPSDERWTSFEAQVAVSGSACRVSVPIAFVAGSACFEVEETSELVSIDDEACTTR